MMPDKVFSSSSLKIIAISLMLIDHIAAVFVASNGTQYPVYVFMRLVGRLAFPIFAFLIAEGFYYTKNYSRYLIRLIIFALLSEIPFDLAFYHTPFAFEYQNVFFTLAIGLIAVYIFDMYKEKNLTLAYISLFLLGVLSIILRTDYSVAGVLMIFSFYYFRGHFIKILISIFFINFLLIYNYLNQFLIGQVDFDFMGIIQIFALLSLVLIYFYNHKKGFHLKYVFYLFYPVHLLLLYLLMNI